MVGGLGQVVAGLELLAASDAPGSEMLEAAEAALASARQARKALVERQRLELASADRAVRQIEQGLVKLRGELRPRSAAVQAGPMALRAVSEVLAVGAMSQKAIVERTGLNVGTVSSAVKALREQGSVELTGAKVDGSRELRLVAPADALYAAAREIVGGAPAKVKS